MTHLVTIRGYITPEDNQELKRLTKDNFGEVSRIIRHAIKSYIKDKQTEEAVRNASTQPSQPNKRRKIT